jgi:hypothetical protein
MDMVAAALAERQKAMTDPMDRGIGSLVRGPEGTLEAKVRIALAKARPVSELEPLYIDKADRRRVRGRELISLALKAIIDSTEDKRRTNPNGSVDVLLTEDSMSDLATALREFDHDRTRIDMGATAELVLKPIAREAVDSARSTPAGRVLLIHWLVVIQLWNKRTDLQFRTQTALLNFAAGFAHTTAGRLKTERKKFHAGSASRADLILYQDLIDDITNLARIDTDGSSPFRLFLPGVMALSS